MTIRARLYLIMLVTVLFSGLSLFAVHQVSKGAFFHQLNSLHLKYTIELRDQFKAWNPRKVEFTELEKGIKLVRAQPLSCIENINTLDALVMTMIGTQNAIQICRDDIDVANRALQAIERYKSSQISLVDVWIQLSYATVQFSKHSSLFETEITKTVNFMTEFYSGTILFLSIGAVFLVFQLVQAISAVIRGRSKVEADLKASEIRFRSVVENAGDAIYIHDRFGKIHTINELARKQTGYSFDELMSFSVNQLDATGEFDKLRDTWSLGGIDQSLYPMTLETEHRRKNGTIFPIEQRISLLPSDGQILFVSMVRDISQRKKIQRELEFQKSALDEHAIVSIANLRGNILYVNEKFCQVSGYTREELIGRNHRILKSDVHSVAFYEDMWNTISSGGVWQGEIKNIARNGQPYWVMSTIVPTLDAKGKPFQYVAIRTDITKRKAIEQIAVAAQQEAEQANQAKSQFLSSMSHELRTPLNAIFGFSQLLQSNPKEPLTENQKESVDLIIKGGQHLLELVNDVLELSKIEAGKIKLFIEDIQVSDVLRDTLPMVSKFAESRNIKINLTDSVHQHVVVRADFTRLKQVLLNLLSNAIKYNTDSGKVTVLLEEDGAMMRVSVVDTGPGIRLDLQVKLFQAFNRLGAENSDTEGTGIGLVVCKDLVELMGGTIGHESTVGVGSTFWIELPMANDQAKTIDQKSDTQDQCACALINVQATLLYVEDNLENVKLMKMIVSKIKGLSLITAQTGEIGVELARSKKPDIIILDIHLPLMSGFDVLELIQNNDITKDIPVIALSAAASKTDIEKGKNVRFFKYLTKPMQIPVIVETIQKALRSKPC